MINMELIKGYFTDGKEKESIIILSSNMDYKEKEDKDLIYLIRNKS
jgi:hypothetical protein